MLILAYLQLRFSRG